MFRKFSESAFSFLSNSSTSSLLPSDKSAQPAPESGWRGCLSRKPQAKLKTASDSNLMSYKKTKKENATKFAPKPSGTSLKEVRSRRATISSDGLPDIAIASLKSYSINQPPPPVKVLIQRKIVSYIPELYEEVDPIRQEGRMYTWDNPSWLNYAPLPPPPRKKSQCGRIASKPKMGPGDLFLEKGLFLWKLSVRRTVESVGLRQLRFTTYARLSDSGPCNSF
ncbi:hypothetical protein R3P38DRAFT_3252867 [Favolaschia claudopus]|uniref:Uncharacterized protein n=1 Tax=Favolaschia claudopus TaxID=2862362 RepID=A0AAW0E3R3_9AGAR